MKPNTVLLLQSGLVFCRTANALVAAELHNAVLAGLLAAFVGGFQFYVNHIGNQIVPSVQPKG